MTDREFNLSKYRRAQERKAARKQELANRLRVIAIQNLEERYTERNIRMELEGERPYMRAFLRQEIDSLRWQLGQYLAEGFSEGALESGRMSNPVYSRQLGKILATRALSAYLEGSEPIKVLIDQFLLPNEIDTE